MDLSNNCTDGNGTECRGSYDFHVPYDTKAVIILTSFISVFFLVGFLANLVTIMVIIRTPKLRDVFNVFIVSLCISDLISAIISPINLYRRTWGFEDFELPNFFCILYWGGDIWTSYVTSLHIASFAILRCISIWKPFWFKRITIKQTIAFVCSLWAVSFCCGFVPMSIWRGKSIIDRTLDHPTTRWPSCTQYKDSLPQYKTYSRYAFSIFIYLPLVVVVVVSCMIGILITKRGHLFKATKNRTKNKENQALFQLGLIVASFMLGYIPFTVFEFYTTTTKDKSPSALRFVWWLGTGQYILLRFSECLNPFFYNIGSTKMRVATFSYLKNLRQCHRRDNDSSSATPNISTVSQSQI